MTDVFFSYSSKDRERVRPIRDALIAEGFDVFWDQEVPPGRNWDEWIRLRLNAARCTIVFWSGHSVRSDNVVHEATIAKNAGKLIPVLLDPLTAERFPMGHYTTQAVVPPAGGLSHDASQHLLAGAVVKAVHGWMRLRLAELTGRGQLEAGDAALLRRSMELESSKEALQRGKVRGQIESGLVRIQAPQLDVQVAGQTVKHEQYSAPGVKFSDHTPPIRSDQ
jgi:hypothetical protein